MSAYVLDHGKLNCIVQFVSDNPNCLLNTPYFYYSLKKIGNALLRENKRSVEYRYSHNPEIVRETKRIPTYSPQLTPYKLHVSSVIPILEEWDYNACECPDYESTDAAKMWRAIARYAVNLSNELEKV